MMCQDSWKQCHLTALAALFKDVSLVQEEFDMVIHKLCQGLLTLEVQSVPPLVYQLLHLCKPFSFSRVLSALMEFFENRIDKKKRQGSAEILESTQESADLIGRDPDLSAAQQMEGTVMFHITQAINMGHSMHKDVVKIIKAGGSCPELLLQPFVLYMALCMTSVKMHRQVVIDCLKSAITKNISFSLRCHKDAWFKESIGIIIDTKHLFKELIEQTKNHGGWELIGKWQ